MSFTHDRWPVRVAPGFHGGADFPGLFPPYTAGPGVAAELVGWLDGPNPVAVVRVGGCLVFRTYLECQWEAEK